MRIFSLLHVGLILSIGVLSLTTGSAAKPDREEMKRSYEKSKEYFRALQENQPAGRNEKIKFIDRWLYMNRDASDRVFDLSNYKPKNHTDRALSATAWLPLGPENLPPSYESRSGHGLGRINCVAFHPTDKNTFWIGTPGGGIWKTVTGGTSWIPQTDKLATLEISHIAVDPKNPNTLYAATGDYDGKGFYSAKSMGVIKSTDGGTSWEFNSQLMGQTGRSCLKRVLINAENTDIILTCGMGGIWRSSNAGMSWSKICDSVMSDIVVDPVHPDIVYGAMGTYYSTGGSAGIMKSTDFGETWTVLPTGIIPQGKILRTAVAVSPADPNYIYALTVSADYSNFTHFMGMDAVYLSTDAGETWTEQANYTNSSNILGSWNGDTLDPRGQGFYDLVLIADAKDKHKVYSGGVNIWTSGDDGKNWELVSLWMNVFGKSIHADHHDAQFNPLDSSYYWCNDGGIYRTREILPGSKDWVRDWIDRDAEDIKPGHPDFNFPTVWENLSDGLMITEFYTVATCKNVANIVAGGAQDNACFYNNNVNWINYVANYDGMETAIDNNNPEIIYGVWQNGGLCKSTDGGKTVRTGLSNYITETFQERGEWITPLAMDPVNSNTIYMGFRNLWKSTNGGDAWEKALDFDAGADENTNLESIVKVKTSYGDPNYMALFKSSGWKVENGNYIQLPRELWICKNGVDWNKSPIELTGDITSIEYDRANPEIMWIACVPPQYSPEDAIARTTDAGQTWEWIHKDNLPNGINTLVYQGDQKNTLYVGTDWGVYYTNDNLTNWEPLDENLPNAIISDIEIDFNSKRLYAASYGRGIWYKPLNGASAQDEKIIPISVYPNPSHGEFNLDFTGVESASPIEVKILNVQGRKVYSGSFRAGAPATIASDLPTGVYFVVATVNGSTMSAKIEIKK